MSRSARRTRAVTGADINTDDGSVFIESDDGSMKFGEDGSFEIEGADGESMAGGAGSLPEDFPVDEVPLLDLDILMGMRTSNGEDSSWTVSMESPEPAADALDAASTLLTDAGYTLEQDSVLGTGADIMGGRLFSGTWGVNVTVLGDEGAATTLSYTVVTPQE